MEVPMIPSSHVDLLGAPYTIALTTLMPDGQPHSTPVWCDWDGECVRINTMRDFRKAKNMRNDPRVTLLAFDPRKPLRNLEIRGVVEEMSEEGALEHLDKLTCDYMKMPGAHFFGDSVPAELQATQVPVRVHIRPLRVRVEG
jgi:PPOX class probable F420-dependent enzyme